MIVKIDVDGVLRNFTESVHGVFVQEKFVPIEIEKEECNGSKK